MARSCGPGVTGARPGGPGQASAAHDSTSGLPGLPAGPVTRGLLAGECARGEVAARFVLGVLAPEQPAMITQVSVATVNIRNNGRLRTRPILPVTAQLVTGPAGKFR